MSQIVVMTVDKYTKEDVVDRCVKPMWFGNGMPAGLCGKQSYGPPVDLMSEHGWLLSAYRNHGGPEAPDGVRLEMDGNAWCAKKEDFINLQESHAGFGNSKDEAITDLLKP